MPPKLKKLASNNPSSGPRVIYWFRTDLRLHDSPTLTAALQLPSISAFYPIWTWDPHYVYRARVGPNRWRFLTECQSDVSASLAKLNPKQKLLVIREAPQTLFPKLFKLWNITHLVFEKDTDAYARSRDEDVMKLAREAGVEVIMKSGRTLFDSDELVRCNGGKPTMSMAQTAKAAEKLNKGVPARALPAPTSLPDPGDTDLSGISQEQVLPEPSPDFNSGQRSTTEKQYIGGIMGPNRNFSVPTLEEMGIPLSSATSPHRGGETEALRLLASYIANEEYVGTFEKPASAPTDFSPQSTTLLSPHHHFGSLSVRKFWWDVQDVFEKRAKQKKHVAPMPTNFPGQLLFRDMYFGAQAALGYSFAQTQGNPIAKFIPWHLQSTYSDTPVGEHLLDGTYTVDDATAETYFRRWKEGTTGFPWIDALMRQLKYEGWMHHLGRHAVACFLTRGGCYVSWERGAEVFEEWLIDHETACNAGNWMWLSCTAFFSQFYRVYSPIAFPKKWDPEGNFVRKYVPELELFDAKYIYEPWKAPIADQKAWGCVIKGNETEKVVDGVKIYPKPMFDFSERREFCITKMKEAYHANMMGNDPRVLDQSWKQVFDYPGGDVTKDESNGLVTRHKRERSPDGDDELQHGEKSTSTQAKRSSRRPTRGKKQATLDGLVSKLN